MNSGNIFSNSLFMHSLCFLITHSFLNGIQPNLYQRFSHVSSTFHTIFRYLRKVITLQADSCHNLDHQQMICISLEMHNVY